MADVRPLQAAGNRIDPVPTQDPGQSGAAVSWMTRRPWRKVCFASPTPQIHSSFKPERNCCSCGPVYQNRVLMRLSFAGATTALRTRLTSIIWTQETARNRCCWIFIAPCSGVRPQLGCVRIVHGKGLRSRNEPSAAETVDEPGTSQAPVEGGGIRVVPAGGRRHRRRSDVLLKRRNRKSSDRTCWSMLHGRALRLSVWWRLLKGKELARQRGCTGRAGSTVLLLMDDTVVLESVRAR